jgi:hypothetical protein
MAQCHSDSFLLPAAHQRIRACFFRFSSPKDDGGHRSALNAYLFIFFKKNKISR